MKRILILVLILLVSMPAAACSGETTPPESSASGSAQPSEAISQKPDSTSLSDFLSRPSTEPSSSTEPSPSDAGSITDYLDTSGGLPVEPEPDYSFDEGDIQGMCDAMAAWEGWRRGNKPGHEQREIFAELVEEGYDYQGETCYLLETYELDEDGTENRLTEMKVPETATDLNEAWLTDLNDHIPMAYEEEDDAATSELMTRAESMLEKDFPGRVFSVGYAGMGSQKVYIDGLTYFELNIYDAKMDESWFLVLSTEAEDAYVRLDEGEYYFDYPFA